MLYPRGHAIRVTPGSLGFFPYLWTGTLTNPNICYTKLAGKTTDKKKEPQICGSFPIKIIYLLFFEEIYSLVEVEHK